jgi:hypothetical protein
MSTPLAATRPDNLNLFLNVVINHTLSGFLFYAAFIRKADLRLLIKHNLLTEADIDLKK